MTRALRVAFVTPTVNHRGGTEKCASWLIEDLATRCTLDVFTGHISDTNVSGVRVHNVPMIRGPRLFRYVSFLLSNTVIFGMRKLLRRPGYDAVIATSGDCAFATVAYAHFCCARWLELIRSGAVELPSLTLRQRLRNAHYRLFLTLAARVENALYRLPRLRSVVAVSAGTRDDLVRYYGVRADAVTVIPNAVDERVRLSPEVRRRFRHEVRAAHAIAEDAFVALFVAAGDWKRKGLLQVLEGLALLPEPAIRLFVVGREDIPFYAAEAARLGVADRVTFVGFSGEVERYYAAADVFVYPSSYEAFSLVTLEAAGAGLPVIVTRINGVEELVTDGINGFLIERTATDVAARLRTLACDPGLRQRMATAAVESSLPFDRAAVAVATVAVCARASGETSHTVRSEPSR